MSEITKIEGLSVEDQFAPFERQANEWAEKAKTIQVTSATQTDLIYAAREARLALVKTRTSYEKLHKELKEKSLREGQFLDSIKRKLNGLVTPIEAHLQEQEDFEKIQEEKRKKELLNERRKILLPLIGDDVNYMQLGEMSQDVFDNMVTGYKKQKREMEEATEKNRLQQIEDERLRKEEQDRVDRGNIRARQCSAMGLTWSPADQSYVGVNGINVGLSEIKILEADQWEVMIKDINEILTEAALEKKNRDSEALKKQQAAQKKLDEETAERKRLQKVVDDQAQEDERLRKEKEKADRKLKRAPDKTKLLTLAEQIQLLPLPEGLKDDQAKAILSHTQNLLGKVVKYVTDNAELL